MEHMCERENNRKLFGNFPDEFLATYVLSQMEGQLKKEDFNGSGFELDIKVFRGNKENMCNSQKFAIMLV